MNNFKKKLYSQKRLTVVGAGDSHMWGQGAYGWENALIPPYENGEKRRLPDTVPSFLNMLRNYFADLRSSTGETNVINSSFGCASTKKYLADYWKEKVLNYKPDLVIIEFAINDWIKKNNVSLEEFTVNLHKMVSDIFNTGGDVLLLTVSPIKGDQFSERNCYEDYISSIRDVAVKDNRIYLADANKRMNEFLSEGSRGENEDRLFTDNWHVSQIGHEHYFREIIKALRV